MAVDVAMGGLFRLSLPSPLAPAGGSGSSQRRSGKRSAGRTETGRLLFGARKGVVAEPLTDPFATDRNLSANAAPGECGAFPALAWDGGFELGFWNAFSSALATGG